MEHTKFKCWNATYSEWEKYFFIAPDGDVYKYSDSTLFSSIDKLILCQFTGYTDINDKGIYEGDILKIFNNPKDIRMVTLQEFYLWLGEGLCYDDREIIGNIYENPEMNIFEKSYYSCQ